MLKRAILLSGLVLLLAGCNAGDETEETPEETITEEVVEETEEPDIENMTQEELEEYFAGLSEEEINDYLAGLDLSEFEDEDGNSLFGSDGIHIYTEEDALAELEAAYQESFQSEERGSGINPAAVGETITRDVEMIDMESIDEDPLAEPEKYPGKMEITHLGTIYGDEAWDILSENEVNLMYLDEPIDFDYVISEIEVTLIEGEEFGMQIPAFLNTADYEGNTLNTLAESRPTALLDNPFMDVEREGFNFYPGETISGQILTIAPKDAAFLIELMYDVNKFVFFEVE